MGSITKAELAAQVEASRKSLARERAKAARLQKTMAETQQREAATREILRVISASPSDAQPVFEAIVAHAARICDAEFSAVARFDGELLHLVAISNMSPEETAAYQSLFPRPPLRDFIIGRAFVEGRPVHVRDVRADPEYDPRTLEVLQRAAPYRTYLGVPILRDGVPIGVIGCGRRQVKPFTAAQVELVKTFADQAVIAIENVRLFTELEARNSELRAPSSSRRRPPKCSGLSAAPLSTSSRCSKPGRERHPAGRRRVGAVFARFDGEVFSGFLAESGASPEFREFWRQEVIRPGRGSAIGRAAIEHRTVPHHRRLDADPEWGHTRGAASAAATVPCWPSPCCGRTS